MDQSSSSSGGSGGRQERTFDVILDKGFSGRNDNPENRLAYWREDLGVASHRKRLSYFIYAILIVYIWIIMNYLTRRRSRFQWFSELVDWHFHIIYSAMAPATGPGSRDRKGELFYYMHHNMMARYELFIYRNFNAMPNFIKIQNQTFFISFPEMLGFFSDMFVFALDFAPKAPSGTEIILSISPSSIIQIRI